MTVIDKEVGVLNYFSCTSIDYLHYRGKVDDRPTRTSFWKVDGWSMVIG